EAATATGVIEARFFVGYAGWGPGQLEDEVEHGGWLLTPASRTDPFAAADDIWPQTLRRINPTWATLTFNPGIVPEDPNQN
ncbi:YqgE/AlgH family protein, partial [Bacillus sp. SIMBA_161]